MAKQAGLPATFGQSPFAIARGTQFEAGLFREDGERLRKALIESQVLPSGSRGFLDLRTRQNGGTSVRSLGEAQALTLQLLRDVATRPQAADVPALVAGATIRVPRGILLPEAILIIDVLAIRTDGEQPEVIVGEIKTYPDRGGHTDPHQLALARAQAGIYVHGLQLVAMELDLAPLEIALTGFLVLTRPGTNQPAIRAREDFAYQAERAKRGFVLLEQAAQQLDPELWAAPDQRPPAALIDAILQADTEYGEECLAFCDLAPRCFDRACQCGDPRILGQEMQRFLGGLALERAIALLDGAEPSNDVERDVVRRIRDEELGL
ncbi:MAG: hypothetical protein K1X74_17415 [Pirellulales bacterium]|nr:hypothetical protein [Pirellulales bacterium]